ECGWSCKNCSDQTNLHLHVEIENLKQRLLEREHHIVNMETNFLTEAEKFPNGEFAALTEELLTWQEKYSRLYESHKRVQKVNQSLEDKLLKIVDKCETEKTSLTREVANLTQKLMEAKGKVNRLQDENERYRNDVNLAIQLLQCKPANFVSHKFDMLPSDLQQKVRTYVSSKRRPSDGNSGTTSTNKPEPKTIKVPIPTFPPTAMVYSISKIPADKEDDSDEKSSSSKPPVDIVSAAIMAKVLEERERERLNTKHCDSCTCSRQALIDSSTQATLLMDQGILCVRCGSRCDGNITADTSNRASQGLVRYVDVVTTRNGDVTSRNISSGGNQKNDSLYALGTNSCVNVPENTTKLFKHSLDDSHSSKDNESKLISCGKRNEGVSNKINRGVNKITDSCKQNCGTSTKGSSTNNIKETTLVNKNGKNIVKSVEILKSNGDCKQNSEVLDNNCNHQSPCKDNVDLPSNRVVFGNGTSQVNRIPKFPIRSNETYSMRLKNQEGRTYLSDVANTESKGNVDSAWTKQPTDTLAKCTDKQTSGVSSKGNSSSKLDSKSCSKPKNCETVGPRHCSLRVQAGSSNILLDNATSYAPVLYTSRSGDISSTVLVHIPRSRSASASSTDDIRPTSWLQSPTETEL
ncbi:hypothetical protein C0J52_13267, partial [Blattella germanica]